MVMAIRHREKYSHGPSFSAISAIAPEHSMATMMETNVPIKDPVMPMDRALAALPFFVMGYPS